MSIDKIRKYLASNANTPFFAFLGDVEYTGLKDKVSELGLEVIRTSDFCRADDKLPDIDGLIEKIKAAEADVRSSDMAVIGLGEYLALRGKVEATTVLARLKEVDLGRHKAVLLLRGVSPLARVLQYDLRFDNCRCSVANLNTCDLSITLADPSVGLSATSGIKALLVRLENGEHGNIVVNSTLSMDNSLFTVRTVATAHEAIRFTCPSFNLPSSYGTDEQWNQLLSELNQQGGSFESVLAKHGFGDNLQANFYGRIAGLEYRNWLYFIALKASAPRMPLGYLRFVLEKTTRLDNFKANLLKAIIDVAHTDDRFNLFYLERKTLVANFPESDVADFVVNNRKDLKGGIYKLTDATAVEREEIIAWVAKNGVPSHLASIYPALASYLRHYVFNCGELSALLTDYFAAYKRQKLSNHLEADFLITVDEYAYSRKFNRLPTRNEVIDRRDKEGAYLYWLDALGVEYLAFISDRANARGMSISIEIVRAELPTITSLNRDFFDNWPGNTKEKCDELDGVKHGTGDYNFERNELPIHLAKELSIIETVIDRAATALALRHYKRFFVISDHGASRLAVLRRKEEQYEADTKGQYSGRCCEAFAPYDLPFATEENGYLVLADYGRFKGSRAANVEVHGGASLEEVVVPVIEFTLKAGSIQVSLVDENVTVDVRSGTAVTLFSNTVLKDASIVLKGNRYPAVKIDGQHYKVAFPDIKRAGEYPADVYEGDNLVAQLLIKAQGKSG